MKETCPVREICSDWRRTFSLKITEVEENGIKRMVMIEQDCHNPLSEEKCPNNAEAWEAQRLKDLERRLNHETRK